MSIRLIALDMDGTVLRSDGIISNRTVAALRRPLTAGLRLHWQLGACTAPQSLTPE